MTTPLHFNDYQAYFGKAISYQAYKANLLEELQRLQQQPLEHPKQLNYLIINQQRMKRVEKTLQLNGALVDLLGALDQKIYWLVLSEHWCGDAAQSLPALAAIEEAAADKIELKILYRDQNLELMDAFLTNGARAIPRLIQLDADFQLINSWGPRPATAQQLVNTLKSNPDTAEGYAEQLHMWYAQKQAAGPAARAICFTTRGFE